MEIPTERTREATEMGLGRILNRELFFYFLDHEVKRALRYQNFISVLLMRLRPAPSNNNHETEKAFNVCRQALTNVLMEEMRETDILGSLGENKLVVLLPYADVNAGDHAKSRFENTLKYYDFKNWGYEVSIQHFCFPRNGTNTKELIRRALEAEAVRSL